MPTDIKLPELGENIEGGDVLRVMVSVGDRVTKDQPLLELETDKATIEVPSLVQGIVKDVRIKAGEKVKVGQVIVVLDDAPGAVAEPAPTPATPRVETLPRAEAPPRAGMGDKAAATSPARVVDIARGARAVARPAADTAVDGGALVPAAPSARRLARELGVNINDVAGSGSGGRISLDDVTAHARRLLMGGNALSASTSPLPDFSIWGSTERKPMTAVRRATARHLTQAWTTIPHVTQHDRADITGLDALRAQVAKKPEAAGIGVTLTVFAVKVIASALNVFPQFNATVDMAAEEIIYKKYVNVGVAVDTDRGLLVPVIRGADTKNILQLAKELTELADKARTRKLALDEMQGGSFSISNLGGIGGTSFTPIVNWPEVAILGMSRGSMQPVYVDGHFEPRLMMPLSLSYDHRVIDGADAARFLRWVVEALEQPALLWMFD